MVAELIEQFIKCNKLELCFKVCNSIILCSQNKPAITHFLDLSVISWIMVQQLSFYYFVLVCFFFSILVFISRKRETALGGSGIISPVSRIIHFPNRK